MSDDIGIEGDDQQPPPPVGPSLQMNDPIDFLPVEPMKQQSIYDRAYQFLESQRTQLEEIQCELEKLEAVTDFEKYALGLLKRIVSSLLGANFGNLFGLAMEHKEEMMADMEEATKNMEEGILSVGLNLLNLLCGFSYLENFVISQVYQNTGSSSVDGGSGSEQAESLVSQRGSEDGESTLVVCRICENLVPLSLIEEHSKSCMRAYEAEYSMLSIDDRINKLEESVITQLLSHPWPGDHKHAVEADIPLMHAILLLDRVKLVDIQTTTAKRDIQLFKHAIEFLRAYSQDSNFKEIISHAVDFADQKLAECKTFSEASYFQMRTTVNSGAATKHMSTTIADFDFLKVISSGAYARVYLGKKRKTGDVYAIKVTPKSSVKQKNQVKRILAEKDILLQFINPFIVNFYYSIIGKNNLYLVMEFLPGGDLYSLLQNLGSLDEQVAKIYTVQIVAALQYLRANGIIHRDLKPDNVLIAANGQLKLTDFGLSYLGVVDRGIKGTPGQSDESIVESESLVGTPDYLAPEVVMSQPHSYEADYWSLGAMLFEFLYGVPPFHAETEKETFANIVRGIFEFPPDDSDDAPVSENAKDLIRKLLTVDHHQRLGAESIQEILDHPWFSDIDWNHVDDLEPPFVPEITREPSTDYFTERYHFDAEKGENDILEDIRVAKHEQGKKETPKKMSPGRVQIDLNTDTVLAKEFPSVSLRQLEQSNEAVARAYRRRRSLSFFEPEDKGESLIPESPIASANPEQNMPRSASYETLKAASVK